MQYQKADFNIQKVSFYEAELEYYKNELDTFEKTNFTVLPLSCQLGKTSDYKPKLEENIKMLESKSEPNENDIFNLKMYKEILIKVKKELNMPFSEMFRKCKEEFEDRIEKKVIMLKTYYRDYSGDKIFESESDIDRYTRYIEAISTEQHYSIERSDFYWDFKENYGGKYNDYYDSEEDEYNEMTEIKQYYQNRLETLKNN